MVRRLYILLLLIPLFGHSQARNDSSTVIDSATYLYVIDTLAPYQDSIGCYRFVPIPVNRTYGDSLIVVNGDTIVCDTITRIWLLASATAYEEIPAYQPVLNRIAQTGHISDFPTKKVEIIYKKHPF